MFFYFNGATTLLVHAETHIPYGSINEDTVWTEAGSPYILDGPLDISYGYTLTVSPGVTIDTSVSGQYAPVLSMFKGILFMNGTQDKPITVKGLASIELVQSSTTISHVNFKDMGSSSPAGLSLEYSHADIRYSTFKDSKQGLHIVSGDTVISTSSIEGKVGGLYWRKQAVFLMKSKSIFEKFFSGLFPSLFNGMIGRAEASVYLPTFNQGILTIRNSSFPDTNHMAIDNDYADSINMIDVSGNWWGRANDPAINPSRFNYPVKYLPWLTSAPDLIEKKPTICCSSVLFIPGIESSRLYTGNNTLWEPNRNDDVRKLFLNPNGSSKDANIYSGDPIDSAWGYGVYGSFMKFLDGLVAQGTLGEWRPFGYDWRKAIPDVVFGNEKKATTTESLVNTVLNLAKTSKTGKVTIIAHSNGGLVTKYLVKTLADMGKSGLIDSVISVAVPYLGTPQAIGGILHGDDESLAGGLLLKTSVAQELGLNMPSAYSLLPSAGYYLKNPGNTITFASSSSTSGSSLTSAPISSYAGMASFVAASSNASLLASAGNLHDVLDVYYWPANITRWAVVGWNALTTKSLAYGSEQKCGLSLRGWSCSTAQKHEQIKTNMGDGTVVAKSATDGSVISIDLNTVGGGKTAHGNILESATTQGIIKNIISGGNVGSTSSSGLGVVTSPGVTIGEPDYSKESTYIALSTHSPMQPHVYDSQGRHTGEILLSSSLNGNLGGNDSPYHAFENNIPGSSVNISGEDNGEYDSYIYLPDNGEKYSVILKGTGLGSFSLDIDRVNGGEIISHSEYAGLPVTPLTMASTSIQFLATSAGGSSGSFTSSLPVLAIDTDGDGAIDANAIHDATSTITTDSYLDLLKKLCTNVSKSHQPTVVGRIITYPTIIDCKSIAARVDAIRAAISSGKMTQVHDYSDQLSSYIKHRDLKTMTDADNKELWKMLGLFLSQYE